MHSRTRATLTALSIPTDLFDAIERNGHTIDNLRSFSSGQLRGSYTEAQAQVIEQKVKRQPIDQAVVDQVLAASGGTCAYCADGDASKPFQLHHVVHYAVTQDNTQDNLLLVCPTHHAWIHKTGESEARQKTHRRQWYALVEVGREYESRGLAFPYGAFEAVDFGTPSSISEILEPFPASPNTAVDLSSHSLAQACIEQVAKVNFVLIVGASGSGKSTLAVGVAGRSAGPQEKVYRHRRNVGSHGRQVLREIITFLGVKAARSILIVDDANAWATASDMESLAGAATPLVRVVATWTGGKLSDDPSVEVRLLAHRKLLNWEDVRPALLTGLRQAEAEVVRKLRNIRPQDARKVGHGSGEVSLESLIHEYGTSAKSVWHFLFLLRGGWGAIRQDLALLVNNDRADGPVLYAAIEQIADVERPVNANEAVAALVSDASYRTASDRAWVEQVYDGLVARRIMLKVRNGFTTVHRQWACALIDAAIERDDVRPTAILLLSRVFDVHAANPRRMMVLWSWLWNERHAGKHVYRWAESLRSSDWDELVRNAASSGLVDLGMVASRMHLLFSSGIWDNLVGTVMENNEAAISVLMGAATSEDWYWSRELFMALNHSRVDCAARVILHWPAERAATAVRGLRPETLDSAWWLLSGVRKHSRAWCSRVGTLVDKESRQEVLKRFPRGDLASVERFSEVLELLDVPLRRRDVTTYAERMSDLLHEATLQEVVTDFDLSGWLEFFSVEARVVASSPDPVALADQLAVASPRYWGALLEFSAFAQRAGVDFGRRLADAVPDTLAENVRRYGDVDSRELRLLVWQLAYGSLRTKALHADQLFDVVRQVCARSEAGRAELVRAFCALDGPRGSVLAQEYAIENPRSNLLDELGRPLLSSLPNGEVIRGRIVELDASGTNYEVWSALGLAGDGDEAVLGETP